MNRILAMVLCSALLAGGCMDMQKNVHVKKDGSATIEETVLLSAQAMAMMAQQGQDPLAIVEAKYQEAAKKMGEGVTYVKAEKVSDPNTTQQGLKVTYAVEDINKLKLLSSPTAINAPSNEEEKALTFEYNKDTGTLTLTPPPADFTDKKKQEEFEQNLPQMQMMAQMMQGLRMRIGLTVEGAITETNATYPNEDKTGLTLIDAKLGEMFADIEKMKAMYKVSNEEEAKKLIKDWPALKMELEKKVTVKFK